MSKKVTNTKYDHYGKIKLWLSIIRIIFSYYINRNVNHFLIRHVYLKLFTEFKENTLLDNYEPVEILELNSGFVFNGPRLQFLWCQLEAPCKRVWIPLNFLDGSISVAHCNVMFFPILLSTISKKSFDLNLQGGACECYHYEHNFNWNIIFQGSCTISETDNFKMR